MLWALLLRGVSIHFSALLQDPLWRSAWQMCFVTSNVLLTLLIGTALGNILRGVPLTADGTFALPLFTNFNPTGDVGILDWYTVSIALFTLCIFAAHGAAKLALHAKVPVRTTSARIASRLWCAVAIMLVVVTLESSRLRSGLIAHLLLTPSGWIGMICVFAGLTSVLTGIRSGRPMLMNAGSSTFVAGLTVVGATSIFPNLLRSTVDGQFSLSACGASTGRHGMLVALIWWPIALALSFGYFMFVRSNYRARLSRARNSP